MSHPILEIREGKYTKQVPIEQKKLTIGRHAESSVVIDDTQASRNHCVIELTGNDYMLRDLGSRNGTRVNGRLVESIVLAPNDVITIGLTSMRFVKPSDRADGAELLTADDLVAVAPEAAVSGAKGDDYEGALEQLANSLPDGGFYETDIELINARGSTIHETPTAKRGKGKREAVEVFRLLLLACFRSRASDIHIEPKADGFHTRLRIDGTMVDVMRMPNQFGVKLTTLVKVLSDIDIAQRNSIQEGHFTSRVPGAKGKNEKQRVDYRVSFAP